MLRQLPWYGHPSKKIVALCFDPSGSWLLIATKDATLYILPALRFVVGIDHQRTKVTFTPYKMFNCNLII